MTLPTAYLLAWAFPLACLAALIVHRYRHRRRPWTDQERKTWARQVRRARRNKQRKVKP